MVRRASRPSWLAHSNSIDSDCPVENASEWSLLKVSIENYGMPEAFVPEDPTQRFRISNGKYQRAASGDNFVHVGDLESLQGSYVDPARNWAAITLPAKEYPLEEPKPVRIPPIRPAPVNRAGPEPAPPQETDYGLNSKGLMDALFGRSKREDERKRFETDNRAWERKHQAWQEASALDAQAHQKYSEVKAFYEIEVSKASEKYIKALEKWTRDKGVWCEKWVSIRNKLEEIRDGFYSGAANHIESYFDLTLRLSAYPAAFPRSHNVVFDKVSGVLLVEMQLPNMMEIPICKDGPKNTLKSVSDRERKLYHEQTVYAVAIRSLYELASADEMGYIKTVALNGSVNYTDGADGHRKSSFILSVTADPVKIRQLNISDLVPKDAFKSFAGRASPNLVGMVSVPPILVLDRTDRRIVESNFKMGALDVSTNLAAMPWEDFEHLIREMFSQQFSGSGAEVKVTRASRDGGVDAIAWDPDPIRGGKFVIQAKRYTNTVGVSAVRDLYGTLINEGANRGLLVTTSGFGPDAIEFAKDKAISLIDGPMLLGMLESQGYSFRIDLAEAKRLAEGKF